MLSEHYLLRIEVIAECVSCIPVISKRPAAFPLVCYFPMGYHPVSTSYLKTKLECDKKSNCGAVNDKFVKCWTLGLELGRVCPRI